MFSQYNTAKSLNIIKIIFHFLFGSARHGLSHEIEFRLLMVYTLMVALLYCINMVFMGMRFKNAVLIGYGLVTTHSPQTWVLVGNASHMVASFAWYLSKILYYRGNLHFLSQILGWGSGLTIIQSFTTLFIEANLCQQSAFTDID